MRARSAFLMIAIVAAGTLSAYAQDEDFDEPDDLSQFIDEEIEGDEHEYETTESVNRGPQGSQADELVHYQTFLVQLLAAGPVFVCRLLHMCLPGSV